ncbi:hypothetical protein T439DRAFT_382360 [Meredithblackwellia eburnea MCA 4105]
MVKQPGPALSEKDFLDSLPLLASTSADSSFSSNDGFSDSGEENQPPQPRHVDPPRPRSWALLAWRKGTVLVLVLGAAVMAYVARDWKSQSSLGETSLKLGPYIHVSDQMRAWEDSDPYNQPGYMDRDDDGNGIRWIPYIQEDLIEPAVAVRRPASATPIEYARLLDSPLRSRDINLEFARNRTILLIGESLDRDNAHSFCQQHREAEVLFEEAHMSFGCRMPDLGLTIGMWFTSGMREAGTPWFYPNDPKPEAWEDRMVEKFLPTLEVIGKPDLVILASHYWDLLFMQDREYHRREAKGHSDPRPFHITLKDLAWHRRRLTLFVKAARETFPSAQVMFRLGTKWRKNEGFGEANLGVFKLNESSRALMRALSVPIFNWASLLEGDSSYKDDQHFNPGQTGWLFTSMALHYLAQHVGRT